MALKSHSGEGPNLCSVFRRQALEHIHGAFHGSSIIGKVTAGIYKRRYDIDYKDICGVDA